MPDQEVSFAPSQITPAAATPPPGPVGPSTAGDPLHPVHAAVRSRPYAQAAAASVAPAATPEVSFAPDQVRPMNFARVNGQDVPVQASAAAPPRAPVAARGSAGTPPYVSDETGRMLGGMAGAGVVGAATEGLGLIPEAAAGAGWAMRTGLAALRAAPSVAGAAAGGATAATIQGTSPTEGATEQGLLEAGGQLVSWPLKAVARRLLAHPVAKAAAEHLGAARNMVNQQLDEILGKAEAAVRGTREGVANAVSRAKEAVRGAKATAGLAEEQAAKDTAAAAAKWPGRTRPGPPLAVSHTPTAPTAATPPPNVAAPTVFDPSMVPVGEEAAHNALRTNGTPSSTPPPASSAKEQVIRDTRNPDVVAQAKAAQQRAATAPPAVVHPGPATYAQTGRNVADVVQGPARHSLDQLGQAVEDAAKTGPDVDMRPIKARLEAMSAAARPSTVGGKPVEGADWIKQATQPKGAGTGNIKSNGSDAENLARLKAAGIQVEDTHPLPGVLSQIQNAPDSVSFADAHKYKRLLDDATNWSSPAKKQLQGITKGIRGELRTVMASHAPYNQATEAYQAAVPLFTKGVAKQITRSVADNPEAIAKLVKPDQPTKLQMLHDVLVHHATVGGGEAEGREAWNGVRSALTWEHLIKPGIENFDKSFAKFHPDVVKLAYGDPEGKMVLDNLQQISGAFKQAQAGGEAAVGAAKAGVTAAQDTAARTSEAGRQAVAQKANVAGATRTQVAAAKRPTAVEEAFQQSSLASAPPPSQVAGDVLHTVASHGGNVFRARSIGRLALGGPKVADLVQWASYSPQRTQLLVRAVTSPAPGMLLADLYRTAGIQGAEEPPMAVGHSSTGTASAAPPR